MRFWVDIENMAGAKLGSGPVTTAQYFEATTRLSKAGAVKMGMPGSDEKITMIIKKNRMRAKTMIGQAITELGYGIIDHVEKNQDSSGAILFDVSGDDLMRELTDNHVGELIIDDGAGGLDDDGPTVIMALARTGWSLDTTEGYANSFKAIYHEYDGETVLEALVNLAKLTGEHFRQGTGRTVIWMRKLGSAKVNHSGITGVFTLGENVSGYFSGAYGVVMEATAAYLYIEDAHGHFMAGETVNGADSGAFVVVDTAYNPSTGLRAVQGINPLAAEDNTEICIIVSLKEIEDSYEAQIGKVYAIGSGTGPAKLTLSGATVTPPIGYFLGNDARGYFLKHDNTWSTYAIERRKSFKDAQKVNELYEQAYEYLSRAKDSHMAYELSVTKLDQAISVGKTIRVIAQRWFEGQDSGARFRALNVDAELYILEVTNRMDANGLRSASLVVATVDAFPEPVNDMRMIGNMRQQLNQIMTHTQP